MAEDKQTVTVEDYSHSFVQKIICAENYSKEGELQAAGKAFYSLLKRLARDGDREDVRIPFKILKDEFGQEWRDSSKLKQEGLVQRLFRILDYVHDECQANLSHSLQGNVLSEMILEEFRLRIAKMVTGETWVDILPMRMAALKRMYKYMQQEMEFMKQYSSSHLDRKIPDKPKFSAMGKFVRNLTGPAKNSWSAVFDDLFLTSGEKLAPLLFSLLDENISLTAKVEQISSMSESEDTKNPTSSRVSCPSSGPGSETGTLDVHSVTGKRHEPSLSGSNLIDFPDAQMERSGSLQGSEGTSPGKSSVARVQAALERISTMHSGASSQQSLGGWVAFEESASEPVVGLNRSVSKTQSWSPDDQRSVSRSGSFGNLTPLDRPPMPKSLSSKGREYLGLPSGSLSHRETGSPSMVSTSMKGVMLTRHFDNLDPLKKRLN